MDQNLKNFLKAPVTMTKSIETSNTNKFPLKKGSYILKAKKSADSTFQSQKICGKVRKSQRQHFATRVRNSIKSLRNASFENRMSKRTKKCVYHD